MHGRLFFLLLLLHCTHKLPPEPQTETRENRLRVNRFKGAAILDGPSKSAHALGYVAFGDEMLLLETRNKWQKVRTNRFEGWLRDTHACVLPEKSKFWYEPFPINAQNLFEIHPSFLVETAVYELKSYAKTEKYWPNLVCELDFSTYQVHAVYAKDCKSIWHRVAVFVFKRFDATQRHPYAVIGLVEAGLIWKPISIEKKTNNTTEGVIGLIPYSNGAELNPECPSGI